MKFVDRVKSVLLERKNKELAAVEAEIRDLNKKYAEENENVNNLKQESNDFAKEKAETRKKMLSKKELNDLGNIYEFIVNYPRIEKILEKIKESCSIDDNQVIYTEMDIDTEGVLDEEELMSRYYLYNLLKPLNEQIIEIKDSNIEDLLENKDNQIENTQSIETNDVKPEKKSIFSKIFRRKEKNKEDITSVIEDCTEKDEKGFDKYRETINEYKEYYSKLIDTFFNEDWKMDKAEITRIISLLNSMYTLEKRGIELDEEDEMFLKEMQPLELWNEIYRYYSNMGIISHIIQNFENNIDKYEQLYHEDSSLFNSDNLQRIFQENDAMLIDLKSKNKGTASKFNELANARQGKEEINSKLKSAENKKKSLVQTIEQISCAESLKDLGYKNKEDAAKKLSMDIKDYIVIPIPYNVSNVIDLFNEEKNLKIEFEGRTFLGTYSNDVASGKINSIENNKNVNATLMIPIKSLRQEDIDSIKASNVGLNSSVLSLEGLLAILPEGRRIDFGDSIVEKRTYSHGDIKEQVKKFLGEDYDDESNELENYGILKKVPNVSSKEKRFKREAVKKCLFENVKKDISYKETILVNGKTYFLNQDDEKDLKIRQKSEPLNEEKLDLIADEIETYLIEDGNKGYKIDSFYESLLLEYLRVDKKAKADYYNETDTTIMINGKGISMKPILPAKDKMIAKKYSRPNEDVAYKTMKLANLVNKFAHITQNGELQNTLFEVKKDLVENVIDLSKDNPKINVKKKFDEEKMVTSVVLEVPGYNMIALHVMEKNESLTRKVSNLDERENDIIQTSVILAPGVNRDLLTTMKRMNIEERMKLLLNLDSNTFSKLVLRMGYSSEGFATEEERRSFIQDMVSDKKIEELIKNNDELER